MGDAHWNFATFYIRQDKNKEAYFHFSKAQEAFQANGNDYENAKMLYAMGRIKGFYRDYAGGEILIVNSIKLFKSINKSYDLYHSYNYLGLLQEDIKEFNKALFYYDKSLKYYHLLDSKKDNYLGTFNNIANVHFKSKNYKEALKYYKLDLEKSIRIEEKARVISNLAYCKLHMGDTLNIKNEFFQALKIRDSLKNKTDILTSKIHLSDYYTFINDTLNALKYAKEANKIAENLNNGRDYLTTLNQLANLDSKNSKKYLDRYIEFNDSLIIAERRTQNKFTRIEFETDEYIAETERLNQQRIWILVTSIGGILILSLLYFLRVQKVRNEKLRLEAEQQKANEEVYILTLQQQAKLEEERVNERNRISAELHDGILGKLFGTRVNLGFLAMGMQAETQEKHQTFLDELQDIEKEIRDVSHKLSDNFDSSNINFTNILEQLLKDKSNIGNFQYQFNVDKNIIWKDINEITKANLYRIIQEALQNIIKHANAKNVILDASIAQKELIISLHDDGIGFNTNKKKKGIGLKNMKARVEKIGSQLELHSTENKGTTLVIKTLLSKNDGN